MTLYWISNLNIYKGVQVDRNAYFSSMMLAGEVAASIGAADGSLDMQLDLRDWKIFISNFQWKLIFVKQAR